MLLTLLWFNGMVRMTVNHSMSAQSVPFGGRIFQPKLRNLGHICLYIPFKRN